MMAAGQRGYYGMDEYLDAIVPSEHICVGARALVAESCGDFWNG